MDIAEPEAAPAAAAPELLPRRTTSHGGAPVEAVAVDDSAEFPTLGISVEGIDYFLAKHRAAIAPDATTSDVCHTVIRPATVPSGWRDVPTLINPEKRWYSHAYRCEESGAEQKAVPRGTCSYCSRLLADEEASRFVGQANVFLSHAWTFSFLNVVEAIRLFAREQPRGAPVQYFWFDTFSVDEHASQARPQSWWSTTFMEAIAQIGHTVMVLSPWEAPLPLTRAWCLWEIYSTDQADKRFDVAYGPAERNAFQQALQQDCSKVIMDMLSRIDVASSEAGNAEDLDMILAAVKQAPGGFRRVNALVSQAVRGRLLSTALRLVTAQVDRERDPSLQTIQFTSQVAGLHMELGKLKEARALYGMVIKGYAHHGLGREHAATLSAQMNMATVLAKLGGGNLGEAQRLSEAVWSQRRQQLGALDPLTLNAQMNLAEILRQHGEATRSEELLRTVVAGRQQALGQRHSDTLDATVNLAILLEGTADGRQGRVDEARILLENVVEARSADPAIGAGHVRTLTAMENLGNVLNKLGDREEGRRLLQLVVAGYEDQLGVGDRRTLSARENLAVLLQGIGDETSYIQARALLTEVVRQREQQLSAQHPATVHARQNLERLRTEVDAARGASAVGGRPGQSAQEGIPPTPELALDADEAAASLAAQQRDGASPRPGFARPGSHDTRHIAHLHQQTDTTELRSTAGPAAALPAEAVEAVRLLRDELGMSLDEAVSTLRNAW